MTDDRTLYEFIRARGPHCLIIGRHGETEWNAAGRLQGQQDVPLNGRGLSQALAASEFLRAVPLSQIYSSALLRCRQTAWLISEANVGKPQTVPSELLKETALGVLEGELKSQQSTGELTRQYEEFSRDEVCYRVPGGESLHDVYARIERFFADRGDLMKGPGTHLIVGHRNVNKMIVKHLLGLSFEEAFRVEHQHQQLYLYFGTSSELWACRTDALPLLLTEGYHTTLDSGYA